MLRDVEYVIARCQTCMRQARTNEVRHPAIAIQADSVFDNLIWDTSWGFPETVPDKFHAVLTIIDRFSKFPFVYPLMFKNAEEIAEKLLDVIGLTGGFKSIQNDRGTELNNQVVNKLLNITGIDRSISSSFSPRTNGAIEVFNKVFAETLRKCAETDTTN